MRRQGIFNGLLTDWEARITSRQSLLVSARLKHRSNRLVSLGFFAEGEQLLTGRSTPTLTRMAMAWRTKSSELPYRVAYPMFTKSRNLFKPKQIDAQITNQHPITHRVWPGL